MSNDSSLYVNRTTLAPSGTAKVRDALTRNEFPSRRIMLPGRMLPSSGAAADFVPVPPLKAVFKT